VIRKHTRRAVKAAFAISFGVAILIGGGAQAARQASQPTVVIGTKNFTEQYVLGQLYKQALEAKGFKVGYKENIGSSELIDTALTSGKINFYPEYTGVIVADLAHLPAPKTAAAAFAAAKKFEEGRGFTVLNATPFYDADTFSVLKSTALKYGLKTISDIKKVPNPSYGGYPECRTRPTCLKGLQDVYGLKNLKFVALGTIPVSTLIDQGKITGGDIFSTEPVLASGKYVQLQDTKHIFGFQNVVPIVSKQLVSQLGSKFNDTINAVSSKLTLPAMVAMNKAVGIDKQSPASVAAKFLKANGLA
jgi:osmoprotectant transport system substrate-binding protein